MATAYVSVDGHKSDDLQPYVYVTRDYGKSWNSISANLPTTGNVNTVRQDPRNRNLLYAGTEFGFFVSFNAGRNWQPLQQNLPATPVTDIKVHRNDLVISTMGRSAYIMDNITPLQQLAAFANGLPSGNGG